MTKSEMMTSAYLTSRVASGKTTVAGLLEALGLSADASWTMIVRAYLRTTYGR